MPAFSPAYGFYDVTAYGADPTGVSDSSASIVSAESACEVTGGVVYFPPGTYLIETDPTITITKSGIQWRGTGSGSSVLVAYSGRNAPTMIQVGSSTTAVSDVTISDIGFLGNGHNPTSGHVNSPVIAFGG